MAGLCLVKALVHSERIFPVILGRASGHYVATSEIGGRTKSDDGASDDQGGEATAVTATNELSEAVT